MSDYTLVLRLDGWMGDSPLELPCRASALRSGVWQQQSSEVCRPDWQMTPKIWAGWFVPTRGEDYLVEHWSETLGLIVPRSSEGICEKSEHGSLNLSWNQCLYVSSFSKNDIKGSRFFFLHLFVCGLFLMQHIRLPITRTSRKSNPTTRDTLRTTRPGSTHTHTNTHQIRSVLFYYWMRNNNIHQLLRKQNLLQYYWIAPANKKMKSNQRLFLLVRRKKQNKNRIIPTSILKKIKLLMRRKLSVFECEYGTRKEINMIKMIPSVSSDSFMSQKGGAQPGSQWHVLSWLHTCQNDLTVNCVTSTVSRLDEMFILCQSFSPRGCCIWTSSRLFRTILCFWCLHIFCWSTPVRRGWGVERYYSFL